MNNLYSVTRSLFLSVLFLISLQAFGQQSVSIGTTEIKSNAVLYLLGSGSQGLIIPVTDDPSGITPTAGMVVFNSTDQKVYFSDGTNWAPINGGVGATDSQTLTLTGNTISISNGNSQNIAGTTPTTVGQILTWDGSRWTSSSGANAPAVNQVLQWNGTTWAPTTLTSGGTVTSVSTGTGLTGGPITTTGTIGLANTAVTAGTYGSTTSIPQLTVDAQGRITAAASLNILNANTTTTGLLTSTDWNTFNNKLSAIPTLGGDISGTLGAVSVDRIKSVAVSVNAPTTGQVLQYNGTQWAPTTLSSGGTVTTVTGTLPISVTNNTTTPSITIAQANATTNGYLSSSDWTTFNTKVSNPMTTPGDIIYGGASGTPTRLATGTGFLKGGATPSYSAVNLASADVSGTLALTNGGTGATTAAGARTNLGLGTLSTLSAISSAEITDGTIAAADLSSMSATNGQILKYNGSAWVAAADDVGGGATPTLANGQILVGNGTTNSAAALSGDATLSAGVITIGAGVVTSTKIADGTIAAADLSSMGATSGQVMQYNGTSWVPAAGSGLSSTLNNGNIFVGNGSNVATGVAMSGDATISNTGVLTLANSASTRTNLGLGSLATLSAVTTTEITNGTIAAVDLANASVSGGAGGVITDASITAADLGVGSVDLSTTDVTGTLPLTLGGTGATTAAAARSSLGLGSLATASTITSTEITDATITSADLGVGSVDLATTDVTGTLPLTLGGTGATTAAGARTSLGLGTLATLSGVSTTEITDGTIAAADLSSMSATNGQILKYNGSAWVAAADDVGGGATPTLANGQILIGNGTTNSAAALSGDASLAAGVITIGTGVVTSTKIADGTIAAADLSSMGATSGQVMQYNGSAWVPAAGSGLSSTLNNGNIFVGNGSNVATGVAMSGDATISNLGALTLANSASTRTNLGLGSLATLSTISTTEITNGTIAAVDLANSSVSGGAGGVITDASITAADLGVGSVDLATTDVTGTLPLTLGGTGATTAAAARTSLGLGTLATASAVTSTDITDATITSADLGVGSVDLATTDVTGTLPLTLGGTGAITAAGARTSLGLGTLATLSGVSTTEITDGTIAAVDLSSMSATNGQILKYNGSAWVAAADDVGGGATPTLANGQILIGNGTANSAAALSGDASLAAGVITIGTGVVTSTKILDGTIAAADLSSMGATSGQVMQYNGSAWVPAASGGLSSSLNSANIFVGNGSNLATGVAMSGDATISNTGALTLANSASTRTNLGLGSLATLSTITTTEITNGTIAAVDLANSSVSGGAGGVITDASITAADLGAGSVDLATTDVTGTLPLTLGGTGATTAAAARTSLGLGSLATASAVTSTEIADGTITSSDLGTGSVDLASTDVTGTLPLTLGGTGATTATAARTNLGLGALATLNAVGTTEITDASVTNVKISNVGLGKLLQGGATSGQILKWDGSAWSPAADDVGGGATPTLSNGQILIGNGTTNSAAALSGDATLAAGVITIGAGTVTTTKILDGTIAAIDLANSAVSGGAGGVITDASITAADLGVGSVDLASVDVIGTLAVANGGTNSTATPTNGGVGYGTGTAHAYSAAGTNGQLLQSNGAAAPTWVSIPAFLSPTLTNGNIFVGNGSNVATGVAMSGDATLSNTGVLTIAGNAIGSSEITDASIANADLATGSVSGGIGGVIADGTINAADLSTMSATNGQVLQFNGSLWAPATIGGGVTTLDGLTDVTVTTPSGGQILVNNGGGQFANVAMSGDATMTAAGAITLNNSTATRTNLGLGTLATLNSVGSTEITNGSIAAADLATGSVDLASTTVTGIVAIANGGTGANTPSGALTNLGALSTSLVAGNIWVGSGGNVATPRVMSGDATITNAGVITIGTGAINSVKILDGTIAAADLAVMGAATGQVLTFNGTAWAPAASISSTLTSGNIYVGNSGNVATSVAMSGDATLSNSGVLTIADASITNQKIASVGLGKLLQGGATTGQVLKWDGVAWGAAGDDGISTTLSSAQILVGSAGNVATAVSMSGDATISNTGVLTLAAGSVSGGTAGDITDATITNADINASAAIAGTKIAPAFGTQNISTTGTLTAGSSTTFGAATVTWPGANAAGVLTNNGTGTLSWSAALTTTLASANIFVGNGSNLATAVAMSGDGTLSNTGVLTLSAGSISGGTAGDITDATITAADLAVGAVDLTTTDVTGTLPIALGGTNSTATATNGGVGYGTGTAHAYTAAGTSGQLLQSNGAAAPTWVAAPATVTASNGLTRTVNDIALGGSLTSATSIAMGTNNLTFTGTGNFQFSAGSFGVGSAPSSKFSVFQNVATTTPQVSIENGNAGGDGSIRLSGGTTHYSIGSDVSANAFVISNSSTGLGTSDRFAINNLGNVGIGVTTPVSKLDVEGGVSIGAAFSGTTAAPANGAIIQGVVGIGDSAPTANYQLSVEPSITALGGIHSNAIAYTGAGSQIGILSDVNNTGTGSKVGMQSNVYGLASQSIYGNYSFTNHTGTGNVYGSFIDANKAALQSGSLYGVSVTSDNDGTGNSFLLYGASIGSTTGIEYGLYVTGEDQNYFSQKVGIGVTAPINRLDVEGGAVIGATYSGTNTAPTNGLLVEGSVSIGLTTATRKLNVAGDVDASGGIYLGSAEYLQDGGTNTIMTNSSFRPTVNGGYNLGTSTFRWNTLYATNGTINTSDRRLKKNIHNLNYGLSDLMKLRPVSFEWKDKEGMRKLGLIAQEVLQVLPEIVDVPKEGYMGIIYSDLVPVTVKAIQEQQAIIEKQQAEINALKAQLGQLDTFKTELENLKARVGAEARNTKKRK